MFGFKKKKQTQVLEQSRQVTEQPRDDSELSVKVQALQNLVLEQRQMIRKILQITTMLSEHKRYELIQAELHKLSNMLDRIK